MTTANVRKIPFLGVVKLTKDQVEMFNLNPEYAWKALIFEWLTLNFVFFGWATGNKGDSNNG